MELNDKEKSVIITEKIKNYQAQVYSLKLDLACAEALDDEQWKERIRESTKRLMQLIEVLETELNTVSNK